MGGIFIWLLPGKKASVQQINRSLFYLNNACIFNYSLVALKDNEYLFSCWRNFHFYLFREFYFVFDGNLLGKSQVDFQCSTPSRTYFYFEVAPTKAIKILCNEIFKRNPQKKTGWSKEMEKNLERNLKRCSNFHWKKHINEQTHLWHRKKEHH